MLHCPNRNNNVRIKTKPVTGQADAAVYICLVYEHIYLAQKPLQNLERFRLFLGLCGGLSLTLPSMKADVSGFEFAFEKSPILHRKNSMYKIVSILVRNSFTRFLRHPKFQTACFQWIDTAVGK